MNSYCFYVFSLTPGLFSAQQTQVVFFMFMYQNQIVLPEFSRGSHLVTTIVERECPQIAELRIGFLHLFLRHTSASLTINENAAPDVRSDMTMALNHIVPESLSFLHQEEGVDDMPAHVKTTLTGVELTIPICAGKLALGTWQGIYICEHRNRGGRRRLLATIWGQA